MTNASSIASLSEKNSNFFSWIEGLALFGVTVHRMDSSTCIKVENSSFSEEYSYCSFTVEYTSLTVEYSSFTVEYSRFYRRKQILQNTVVLQ